MMKLSTFNPLEVVSEAAEMEFCKLESFNEGGAGVFWSEEGGPSPWEMHPQCDELLHAIEGEIEIEVLPLDGGASSVVLLTAGSYLVVPKGCWHRQNIRMKAKEFYLTPGPTLHSNDDDPRAST
jgi:mannose-6-phosphate isomerase-like protein (cupin superfamily)